MALYPEAKLRLLPENRTQPHITPRAFIAHSQAGGGSLYGFWLNGSSLESTIWVSFAGLVEQYMDTLVRADANGAANGYATSAETESSVQATERWTPPQAAALVRFIVWWCRTHGVSPVLMTSPTGAGLAYHVLFGAPGPWTKARGKTCPGPARIRQFISEIIPMVVAQLTKGATSAPAPIPAPSPDQLEELELMTAKDDILRALRPTAHRLTKDGPTGSGMYKNDVWIVGPGWRAKLNGTGGPVGQKQKALDALAYGQKIPSQVPAAIDPDQIIALAVLGG